MNLQILKTTAKAMVAPGKGLLAIDESTSTCKKRFESVGVECNEENRRAYRELLIVAPDIENFISGMIFYDETIRQKTKDGVSFPEVLTKKGILPGIKVDTGAKDFALHAGEKITEGLDNLRERLTEYKTFGAKFAKWRAVITIGPGIPTQACIKANVHAMARYAALCQEADVVPVVEPECLIDGDHTIERCYEVTTETLKTLFAELKEQGTTLEGTILKTSMVISGKSCPKRADALEVAKQTAKCLKENIPPELAGVVFLSGGQSDEEATAHLNEINKLGPFSWPVSFSYARAIQGPALKIWAVKMNDAPRAQRALAHRAKLNSLATFGKYALELEKETRACAHIFLHNGA